MSFGIGTVGEQYFGADGSDTWGGPMNGVDIQDHSASASVSAAPFHARVSVDTYIFLMIMGALALLWLFGGVLFKNVRF